MLVRPNVLIGRGEMVETNSGGAIDNIFLRDPVLIYEARNFREYIITIIVHTSTVTNRNHYNEFKNRALDSTGRI